jgi:hypothetical protein
VVVAVGVMVTVMVTQDDVVIQKAAAYSGDSWPFVVDFVVVTVVVFVEVTVTVLVVVTVAVFVVVTVTVRVVVTV